MVLEAGIRLIYELVYNNDPCHGTKVGMDHVENDSGVAGLRSAGNLDFIRT